MSRRQGSDCGEAAVLMRRREGRCSVSERPLTLDEMRCAVERRGGPVPRVPLFWHKFYNAGTIEKYGEALRTLNDSVVDDCVDLFYLPPGNFEAPKSTAEDYKWAIEPDPGDLATQGITSRHVVSSVELIDAFAEAMPDPSNLSYFDDARRVAGDHEGRYCVGWDFFCLFEASWFRFGMADILCEMVDDPDRMRRLLRAFTDYHKEVMTQYAAAGAPRISPPTTSALRPGSSSLASNSLISTRHSMRNSSLTATQSACTSGSTAAAP